MKYRILILLISLTLSCATAEQKQISYVEKKEIPKRIAVLPAKMLPKEKQETSWPVDPKSEKGRFIRSLLRKVLYNHLVGKGYIVLGIKETDKRLSSAKEPFDKLSVSSLCKILNVDGIIYPTIHSASMVSAIAFSLFSIKAEVKMFNRKGKELGSWTEESSKKKLFLPINPASAASALVSTLIEPPSKRQMRMVIYDWGWKIAQLIPDNPYGSLLPKIMSVETNIDKGIFSEGEKITVFVQAEKDLSCSFDIGDFKKAIPMSSVEEGGYKGIYVVKKGDYAFKQPLIIHLIRPDGSERIWIEPEGTITIDGIAPPPPKNITADVSKEGVSISWDLPKASDLKEFIIEKSNLPVGKFIEIARTKKLSFLDSEVSQGKTYYYRIISVDSAGNQSKSNPISVTVPFFEKIKLTSELKGNLIAGTYILDKDATVPEGELLKIGKGVKINIASGVKLCIKGILKINGSEKEPVILKGKEWKGIILDSGKVFISNAIFEGCSSCISANEGYMKLDSVSLRGKEGNAISIGTDTVCELNKVSITGFERGIFISGGKGKIRQCEIKENKIGIEIIKAGAFELINNNVFKNRYKDIISHQKIVLCSNYLGSSSLNKLNIEGDILIKSLLDAPYPHGRKIVFLKQKEISPEEIEKRFRYYKVMGERAFSQRRYGDAYKYFTKALDLKRDKDVYLYLAYTQMAIGEVEKTEKTLKKAIELFPYDVSLYKVYARYLIAKGKTKEAISVLDKAIRLNPDDKSLIYLKECLERK